MGSSELLGSPCSDRTSRCFIVPFSPARRTALTSPRQKHRSVRCDAGAQAHVQLGSSQLKVSKIGLGTLQWGDTQKGFNNTFREDDLSQVFKAALAGGINFFDTAEVYGYQSMKEGASSEQIVGRVAKESGQHCVLGTKFFTVPWTNVLIGGGLRLGRQSIVKAMRASLERLGLPSIQLYQVHFPFPAFGQEVLSEGFAEAVDLGLVEAVGVCNYKIPQLQQFHSLMLARDIPIASNQVKYNVFERGVEKDGTLQACKDLGVTLVAHSPLQQGLLTGKALETGRGKGDEQTVLKLLQFIGAVSGGKSVTQVALGYLIAKGAIPIPGAKNLEQLKDHLGALDCNLDENEVAVIDERLDAAK
ncbi:g2805 [Coccomyxa viridis]|uniref:G2805 protein n=1 Tax=Coccomyxa viridis TaxID=1274662 RepID=A0ABP1FLA3_9CHLO